MAMVVTSVTRIDAPVVHGGTLVDPGKLNVADDDGVVVLLRADAARMLEITRPREASETGKRVRFAAGELGLDIYAMRERLAAKGLPYLEKIEDA